MYWSSILYSLPIFPLEPFHPVGNCFIQSKVIRAPSKHGLKVGANGWQLIRESDVVKRFQKLERFFHRFFRFSIPTQVFRLKIEKALKLQLKRLKFSIIHQRNGAIPSFYLIIPWIAIKKNRWMGPLFVKYQYFICSISCIERHKNKSKKMGFLQTTCMLD